MMSFKLPSRKIMCGVILLVRYFLETEDTLGQVSGNRSTAMSIYIHKQGNFSSLDSYAEFQFPSFRT